MVPGPLTCAQGPCTGSVMECRTQACGFLSRLDLSRNPVSARTSCMTLDKPLNLQGRSFLNCKVGEMTVLPLRAVVGTE